MDGIRTSVVTSEHGYTRVESPWILDEHKSIYGKLIHYLSGGGMTAFGRTVAQEVVRRRHRRFMAVAAVFGALWLAFYLW